MASKLVNNTDIYLEPIMRLRLLPHSLYTGLNKSLILNIAFVLAIIASFSAPSLSQSKTTQAPTKKSEQTAPAPINSDNEITSQAKIEDNNTEFKQARDFIARSKRIQTDLKAQIAKARQTIESPTSSIEKLLGEQAGLSSVRNKAIKARDDLKNPTRDYSARLKELGAAPKDGETEAASITKKRQALTKIVDDLKAAAKQLNLLELESDQLDSLTAKRQKTDFVDRIFVSRKSILNPTLWTDFFPSLSDGFTRLNSIFSAWNRPSQNQELISGTASLIGNAVTFVLGFLALFFIWSKMARPPTVIGFANDLRRIWRAVGGNILVTLAAVLTLFIGFIFLEISTVEDFRVSKLVEAGGESLFIFAILVTVLRSILAPANSEWRLVNVASEGTRKFFFYGLIAATIYGLNNMIDAIATITFMPVEFIIGINAAVSIAYIVLFGVMITTARKADTLISNVGLHSDRQFYFSWTGRFFLLAWAILIGSAIALVLGYVALAHYVLSNALLTVAVVVILYLIHHLVDEIVTSSMQSWSRIGKMLRSRMGLGDETIRRLALSFSTFTDIAVVVIGAPLILSLWTITWVDLSAMSSRIFFGFKVGDIFIEPVSILFAIGIFILGLILVRFFTVWLNRRILERSSIDAGAQNSIATGAKYTGLVLVSGFALTAAGLDFSKLAIVAGALSVGIGFGLQSIVSNFVSGLILLAERPINIGDWVEVSGGEGTVKKINVRSTEIQTFDRCSVVIPNSKFITDPVKNWSLGSPVGRVKIPVGVSYDADPDKVHDILVQCAKNHEQVTETPIPKAMFMDFGASSLDFQLRIFIKDIDNCTTVASDLRFAIFRELKAAGIEIPFPQRDLNIRDADNLAKAFSVKPVPQKRAKKPTTNRAKK